MKLREYIRENTLVLDGATGTMLQEYGLAVGECPETFNYDAMREIHRRYLTAGSKMIFANTFGANPKKLAKYSKNTADVVKASVANAKQAAAEFEAYVALDIGPIGELLEPYGDLEYVEAEQCFREMVLASEGVDGIFIETMTDINEMQLAIETVRKHTDLPLFCTMSFEKNMRTFMGVSIEEMAQTLEKLDIDAMGFNCSVGPFEMVEMLEELSKHTEKPLIAKPNAGLPDIVDGKIVYNCGPLEFGEAMRQIAGMGVKVLGGCCGTTPEHLLEVRG